MTAKRIRPLEPPPPTYAFGYRTPPRPGNEINGLGEADYRRPTPVFHSAGTDDLEWQALDDFFGNVSPWGVIRHVVANAWQLRNKDGPVRSEQQVVSDPEAMTAEIKQKAQQHGAELVGVATLTEDMLYAGRSLKYKYAISLGMSMNREEMAHVPQPRAAVEVLRVYRAVSRTAINLARNIRQMGWPALAYGNPNSTDILQIPIAVAAGLGQLGKHGSLITTEFGSNVRLAAVLTDLPLVPGSQADIGVEDLCAKCRRCVVDCPPDAIFDEKQMVRGSEKWYVNFDKCIPYFVKTDGCAICIQVCPWSVPGRGPSLSAQLLGKRDR